MFHDTNYVRHLLTGKRNVCVARSVLQPNPYFVLVCRSVYSLIRTCCVPTDSWRLMTWCQSCRRTPSSWTMTVSARWSRWSLNFWKTRTGKFRTWQWNGTSRIMLVEFIYFFFKCNTHACLRAHREKSGLSTLTVAPYQCRHIYLTFMRRRKFCL